MACYLSAVKSYFIQGMEFTHRGLETWAWRKMREAPVWEKQHFLFILQWLSPSKDMVVYTSGSTGDPKPVTLPKHWLTGSARLTGEWLGLGPGSIAWLPLPSTGIGGKMMIIRSLALGWHLHWHAPSAAPEVEGSLPIDIAAVTPMQLHGMSAASLSRIKNTLVGGAGITDSLKQHVQGTPSRLISTYGMTETCSHVAACEWTSATTTMVYSALPGVRFSTDSRSCLVIDAAHLDHQAIVTNDIADLTDTTHFTFLGRYDEVINSGGVKVFSSRVEERIAPLLATPFLVHGVPDDRLGSRVVITLEDAPWSRERSEALLRRMKELLPVHTAPKEIRFVERLERTPLGKIKRYRYR